MNRFAKFVLSVALVFACADFTLFSLNNLIVIGEHYDTLTDRVFDSGHFLSNQLSVVWLMLAAKIFKSFIETEMTPPTE